MEARTIENIKTEEPKNLYDLLDEKEKEQENYYPEFDDQAWPLCQLKNRPLMNKIPQKAANLKKSEKYPPGTLNDDLLDTEVFNSPVQEVFSPELQKLLDKF